MGDGTACDEDSGTLVGVAIGDKVMIVLEFVLPSDFQLPFDIPEQIMVSILYPGSMVLVDGLLLSLHRLTLRQ